MKRNIKVLNPLIILSLAIVFSSSNIKGDENSSPINDSAADAAGIEIRSIKPSVYNIVSSDGLLVVSFKSSLKLKIEASLINSGGDKISSYFSKATGDKAWFDNKRYIIAGNNNNQYTIWVRFPEPGEYKLTVNAETEDKKFLSPLRYSVRSEKGIEWKEFAAKIIKSGIYNEQGLIQTLLWGSDKYSAGEYAALIKLLLDNGMLPDFYREYDNSTLLIKAVESGNIEASEYLLKKGANPDFQNDWGITVLAAAVRSKSGNSVKLALLKLLLDSGADINSVSKKTGRTLLHVLAENPGISKQVKTYSDKKVEIFKNVETENTAGNLEMMKYVLSRNADVNIGDNDGLAPMYFARGQMLGLLKQKGGITHISVYPAKNDSPLCKAVLNKDMKLLSSFSSEEYVKIQARTSDGIPSTVLHLAVEQGDMDVLKALNKQKVNWNAQDKFKGTPLLIAVWNNRKDITEFLVSNGADPNASNINGTSPYCFAPGKNPEILEILFKSGIKPDNSNALVNAIATGRLDMVKKLYPDSEKFIKKKDQFIDIAANYAYPDITGFLAEKLGKSSGDSAKYIKLAESNSERFAEYFTKNSKPISVPQKTDTNTGRKGYYTFTMSEFSPYTEEEPDQYLKNLPVSVYVPETYNKEKPAGLMIYILGAYPSQEYKKVMDKKNMIWAGINCYSFNLNDILMGKAPHEVFTLGMVYNMMKRYNIDPSRIYMAGFSWGGRLTGSILHRYPNIFKGGIASGGCDSHLGKSGKRGFIDSFNYAQQKTAIVVSAGDYDYNRDEAYNMATLFRRQMFRSVHYMQEPGKGHVELSGANFEKALQMLDAR